MVRSLADPGPKNNSGTDLGGPDLNLPAIEHGETGQGETASINTIDYIKSLFTAFVNPGVMRTTTTV